MSGPLGKPPRLQIRDRAMDRLFGVTAAQDRVRANATRRQLERLLEAGPVVRVYLFQENGEKDGEQPHSSKRTLEMVVHLTALADDDVDSVLELLAWDVEARLFTDPLLNGEPADVEGSTVDPVAALIEFARMTMAPDEESGLAHMAVIYEVTYYTEQPSVGTLDDFVTADVTTRVEEGDEDTPPARDRITLPQ
jgi:hypothetical protein